MISKTVNKHYIDLFFESKKTLAAMQATFVYYPNSKSIIAVTKPSLFSYGETIQILFDSTEPTKTVVTVHSKSNQFFDWGKNKRNESLIIKSF